jgi:hypothetical protein
LQWKAQKVRVNAALIFTVRLVKYPRAKVAHKRSRTKQAFSPHIQKDSGDKKGQSAKPHDYLKKRCRLHAPVPADRITEEREETAEHYIREGTGKEQTNSLFKQREIQVPLKHPFILPYFSRLLPMAIEFEALDLRLVLG